MSWPSRRQPWSAAAWERVDAWSWTQHARHRMGRWRPAWSRAVAVGPLHVVTTAARRAMLVTPAPCTSSTRWPALYRGVCVT